VTKQFVREAVDEALKLEAALARLRTSENRRAAALLADPADVWRGETARDLSVPWIQPPGRTLDALPGDARRARPRARRTTAWTDDKNGTPVYNVSMPLLACRFEGRPPFRVFNLPESENVVAPIVAPSAAGLLCRSADAAQRRGVPFLVGVGVRIRAVHTPHRP